MITQIETSAGVNANDIIKARVKHLKGLLDIVDTKTGKTTTVQTMAVNLIKAEIARIEGYLKK